MTEKNIVYLDNAATSPLHPDVKKTMTEALELLVTLDSSGCLPCCFSQEADSEDGVITTIMLLPLNSRLDLQTSQPRQVFSR